MVKTTGTTLFVYVPHELDRKVEKGRGNYTKSAFLRNIIIEYFKNQAVTA